MLLWSLLLWALVGWGRLLVATNNILPLVFLTIFSFQILCLIHLYKLWQTNWCSATSSEENEKIVLDISRLSLAILYSPQHINGEIGHCLLNQFSMECSKCSIAKLSKTHPWLPTRFQCSNVGWKPLFGICALNIFNCSAAR